MKSVILVVDDDTMVCELLCDVLNEHVFTVHLCHNGQDAMDFIGKTPGIALVLLDLILPDINGLVILQRLQKLYPDLPVIMLTGLDSESDVVVGLEMGADDYITKPFNPRVVVARIKAVLSRANEHLCDEQSVKTPDMTFNGWHLYTNGCELRDPNDRLIPLTQGEYNLLLALVQNSRRVLSRDRLLEITHNENRDVFDRTIDVLIMRLRRKIEINPQQPAFIKTVRGIGYVFTADIIHHDKSG